MARSKTEIIDDVEAFVAKYGGKFADWYVGISKDPKATLNGTHGFKKGDVGLVRTAASELQAQQVVDYFVGTRGCKGRKESFDAGEIHVYAYRRARHTKP